MEYALMLIVLVVVGILFYNATHKTESIESLLTDAVIDVLMWRMSLDGYRLVEGDTEGDTVYALVGEDDDDCYGMTVSEEEAKVNAILEYFQPEMIRLAYEGEYEMFFPTTSYLMTLMTYMMSVGVNFQMDEDGLVFVTGYNPVPSDVRFYTAGHAIVIVAKSMNMPLQEDFDWVSSEEDTDFEAEYVQ